MKGFLKRLRLRQDPARFAPVPECPDKLQAPVDAWEAHAKAMMADTRAKRLAGFTERLPEAQVR